MYVVWLILAVIISFIFNRVYDWKPRTISLILSMGGVWILVTIILYTILVTRWMYIRAETMSATEFQILASPLIVGTIIAVNLIVRLLCARE